MDKIIETKNYGVYVNGNKKVLIEAIKDKIKQENLVFKKGIPILTIVCECKRVYRFPNYSDFPDKSIKCKCGNYIIKYSV